MNNTVITDEAFGELFREMLERKGSSLNREEAQWRGRVPESFKASGRAALAALAVSPKAPKLRFPGAGRILLTAAVTLAAAGTVTAGAKYAVPAVKAYIESRPAVTQSVAESARDPREYAIPAPWEDYTIQDEASGERMVYKWFGGGRKQLLVEIAWQLPEDSNQPGELETVFFGDLWGTYCEENRSLLLHDGAVSVYIRYWNGGREDVLAYAEAFIEANQ